MNGSWETRSPLDVDMRELVRMVGDEADDKQLGILGATLRHMLRLASNFIFQ